MPHITLHVSTEIVTAKDLSELVERIREIEKNGHEGRIITITCAVTTMLEESLESFSERVVDSL